MRGQGEGGGIGGWVGRNVNLRGLVRRAGGRICSDLCAKTIGEVEFDEGRVGTL